jgi:hypothetical protein
MWHISWRSRLQAGIILMPLLLCGCDAVHDTADKAGTGLHTSYDNMRYRLSKYIYRDRPAIDEASLVQPAPRFCYQAMMDLVCYDRPQPDLHMNLVSVQGDGAASYGYTDYLPQNLRDGSFGSGSADEHLYHQAQTTITGNSGSSVTMSGGGMSGSSAAPVKLMGGRQ